MTLARGKLKQGVHLLLNALPPLHVPRDPFFTSAGGRLSGHCLITNASLDKHFTVPDPETGARDIKRSATLEALLRLPHAQLTFRLRTGRALAAGKPDGCPSAERAARQIHTRGRQWPGHYLGLDKRWWHPCQDMGVGHCSVRRLRFCAPYTRYRRLLTWSWGASHRRVIPAHATSKGRTSHGAIVVHH
jgi:hypothetical protein